MFDRRDFLTRTLGGSSLLAVGSLVPEFLAQTAAAADAVEKGKDTVLVVVELTGGNDGLNTVVPYADDLYHKARPTLGFSKKEVRKLDDYCGLHTRMVEMHALYESKKLAIVRGVGYPNPDRSHFESMDVWQLADPTRRLTNGWLARTVPGMKIKDAGVPGMYIGQDRLPAAMQGADGGIISLADRASFKLQLTGNEAPRKKLIEDLNGPDTDASQADLAAFVRKRQIQTYSSLKKIEEALQRTEQVRNPGQSTAQPGQANAPDDLSTLNGKLSLVSRLIQKSLGTRLYYVQLAGFDTHAAQAKPHGDLLGELSAAVGAFFQSLAGSEAGDRVALMTYSEFGRRVKENGSQGTDHGSGSCLFVAGNRVAGGLVGKHPSLSDLTDGDLRYAIDFRRVYATLLDEWLGVDSRGVLGSAFEKLPLIDRSKKTVDGVGPNLLVGTPRALPVPTVVPPDAKE